MYKEELESDKPDANHQWAYEAFFIVKTTPKRGRKITFNTPAVFGPFIVVKTNNAIVLISKLGSSAQRS